MPRTRKIFLCWSKDRSRAIAAAWAKLLPRIVEAKPLLSTEFQKGREWSKTLHEYLVAATTGIVFVTPENVTSPWIHFEAGALARAVGSRGKVFTYVYGLDPAKIVGPLGRYQSTVATKADTRRLVDDLCKAVRCKPPLEEDYSQWWNKLEAALDEIPAPSVAEIVPHFAERFDRKTFVEPLPDCTNQRWLDRFAAARETHTALREARTQVNNLCRPGARRLYDDLIAEVDGYAMAMSGFLVQERHYDFDDQGQLAAPVGAIKACERRRQRVNELVAILADPKNDTPVFEEAVVFADSKSEHRTSLIHRWEARVEARDALPVKGNWLATALRSDYEYDRIAAYVYQEKWQLAVSTAAIDAARREFEKRSTAGDGSYMPFDYSVRALCAGCELKRSPDLASKLETIKGFLTTDPGKGRDDPLFEAIESVCKAIAPRKQDEDTSEVA